MAAACLIAKEAGAKVSHYKNVPKTNLPEDLRSDSLIVANENLIELISVLV